MLSIFITFLTFVLILISIFMVLVILMQRANANAGMGAAFGGGAAESAFGAETSNILTKATRYCAFAFFGIALVLYILYLKQTAPVPEEGEIIRQTAPAGDAAPPGATEGMETVPEGMVVPDAAPPAEEAAPPPTNDNG